MEHLQYIDIQHLFCCKNTPSFTGKEKDSETGFYYFGARYYDPSLSGLFLSIDPMSDKYPSISPYNYCHWNSLKLKDADGKEDYEVNRMGYVTKCKDQSHAVEGQDRLFAKPLIGHVRFDKNGNTKSAFVSVKEGVLSSYEKGPIGRQENNGMLYDNSIIYNGTKIMHGNNEEKAVEMFEFLSKHTNVEWSIIGVGNSEFKIYALTTSHLIHNDFWGTEMVDELDAKGILLYQFHNHHNSLGASEDDKKVQERNTKSGAMFGYYRPQYGYYDYKNRKIVKPPWKRG